MFLTIKEFWLKWRLRVAEKKMYVNTKVRKKLLARHERHVAKYERIRTTLETMK